MARLLLLLLIFTISFYYNQFNNAAWCQQSTNTSQKLKLTVYHESLCPDSRRFFLEQLVPTYRKIGPYIDLISIPFGHARTIQPDKMICQHGARECQRNRLMACIQTKGSNNMTEIVESLGCLFLGEESPKDCLNKHMPSVDYDQTIQTCQKSQESYKLMEEYEKLTGRIGYVPKITLNDEYSEEIQEKCENHLLEHLCKNLTQQQPEACKEQETTTTTNQQENSNIVLM